MAKFKDLKLALLAAMILVAFTLPGKGEGRSGDAHSIFMDAPRIETRVLVV